MFLITEAKFISDIAPSLRKFKCNHWMISDAGLPYILVDFSSVSSTEAWGIVTLLTMSDPNVRYMFLIYDIVKQSELWSKGVPVSNTVRFSPDAKLFQKRSS